MPGHRHLYNSKRWKRIRRALFASQKPFPVCASCGVDLRYFRWEVDHVKPISKGGDFWDPDNLQLLCRHCHIQKSGREAGLSGKRLEWIQLLGD